MDREQLADELCAYMRFRAQREGLACDLSPQYFLRYLERGIFRFFGVRTGEAGLTSDEQNPAALAAWRGLDRASSFKCPDCGATSHNPNDVEHSYCARCRAFKEKKA